MPSKQSTMSCSYQEVQVEPKQNIAKDIENQSQPLYKGQDFAVWVTAFVFFLLLTAAIFGLGYWRQWDAPSGYSHNDSATSRDRFLPEPFVDEPGVKGRYGPGASSRWYYWRLPPDRVTWISELVIWTCYLSHQISVWVVIYVAQRQQSDNERVQYSTKVRWYNIYLLAINIGFHLLHLLQTHVTYDALAADVSIISSQGSVVVMLAFIFVLEYRDRGLLFGWPSQYDHGIWSVRLRLPYCSVYLVRKYHGYAFAWAAVYTMWYHPMENTVGHAFGFFHTYMLLVQASLIYTRLHLNKYWRFLLETWVTVHGTLIALQTGGPDQKGTKLWPMFCFGFSIVVTVTQLFGLPFWRRVPVATRFIPFTILVAVILGMYSWIPDAAGRPWTRIYEVTFIPITMLLLPVLIFATNYVLLKMESRFEQRQHNVKTQIVFAVLALLKLLTCVSVGYLVQDRDLMMSLPGLQGIIYPTYTLLICLSLILMKPAFNKTAISNTAISNSAKSVHGSAENNVSEQDNNPLQ